MRIPPGAGLVLGIATIAILTLVSGCGDDESPKPVLVVNLSIDSTGVEVAHAMEITATVTGGTGQSVTWYVNGTAGGNSNFGTITPANPATYTAPDSVPDAPDVTVRAVSQEDTSRMDSCCVTVQFMTVYVDGATGDDETGTGITTKPVRSITKGIGLAEAGMTVEVRPGTYFEHDLDVASGISLRSSTLDPASVTVDAGGLGRVFYCSYTISADTIEGFTITGGHATEASTYDKWGGGMFIGGSGTVRNCIFLSNVADEAGGGLMTWNHSSPKIIGCTFAGNTALSGSGLCCWSQSTPLIEDCTFYGNHSVTQSGGALYCRIESPPTIARTIIAFNTGARAVFCFDQASTPILTCCDIFGNGTGDYVGCIEGQNGTDGNFSLDPLFCDAPNYDLRLRSASPCLPGNHPTGYDCEGIIGAWGQRTGCPPIH